MRRSVAPQVYLSILVVGGVWLSKIPYQTPAFAGILGVWILALFASVLFMED